MTVIGRLESLIKRDEKHDVLGSWEKEFVKSLLEQLRSGRTLSVRQNNFLQKIEAKLSDNAIDALAQWENDWDEEKKRNAYICAKYYRDTNYYSYLSNRVLTEPDWVVPRESYEKLCNNKYAQRVLEAVNASPLYAAGTAVTLRATARKALSTHQYFKFKEKPLFVLEVCPEVRHAVKGAKVYKVLSGTSTDVFKIEERFLKHFKKRKYKKQINQASH